MAMLKLGRLPDRNPVKLTLHLSPDLSRTLDEYAQAYEAAYGQAEPLAVLVPAMLESFLGSDREFLRSRKRPD